MTRISINPQMPLIISLVMLSANLLMEYGTLTRRRSVLSHILSRFIALVMTFAIFILIDPLIPINSFLTRAIATTPFYLSCLYLFGESTSQKSFLFYMDYSATSFLSSFCIWIVAKLHFGNLKDLAASLLYCLIIIILLPIYFRYIRPRVRQILYLFRKSNPLYAAFPFLSFVLFTILFGPIAVPETTSWFVSMILYAALIILTYYILFSHFTTVYDNLQADGDLVLAERQLTLQKRYYEEVDKGIQAQNKLLHDVRHHMIALSTLTKAEDYKAIDQYMETLLDAYDPPGIRRFCKNAAANAIIGGYVNMAQEHGIMTRTDLDLPARIGMDDYELCTLFGNTIENAIEACERIPKTSALYEKRYIDIRSKIDKGRLVVRIENTFLDDPKRKDQGFSSSKGSGIGLESVRAAVELYQGSMSCERQDALFVFSAVLRLRSDEKAL